MNYLEIQRMITNNNVYIYIYIYICIYKYIYIYICQVRILKLFSVAQLVLLTLGFDAGASI